MKNKKIMLSVVSGLLVAAVAVGGTLAYMTSKTDLVTNTFTVGNGYITDDEGHQGLWLDETKIPDGENFPTEIGEDRVDNGQTYSELLPGTEFVKDPTFHLTIDAEGNKSVKSYVIAKVTDADAAVLASYIFKTNNVDGFNTTWEKVANIGDEDAVLGGNYTFENNGKLDGYYLFANTIEGGQSTDPIFTHVLLNSNVTDLTASNNKIVNIQGVAVQEANVNKTTAITEAVKLLK